MLDGTWIKDVMESVPHVLRELQSIDPRLVIAIVVIAGIAWAGDELAQVINAFANFVRALFRKK
jgi:hypothetical protein